MVLEWVVVVRLYYTFGSSCLDMSVLASRRNESRILLAVEVMEINKKLSRRKAAKMYGVSRIYIAQRNERNDFKYVISATVGKN